MNLVYGLTLRKVSVAQVDRAPARCLGGHRFESGAPGSNSVGNSDFFSLSHARDMLINSFFT